MSSNESVYEMNRALMGYALIINNLHDDHVHQEGTRRDVENLKKLFNSLHIKVKTLENLSKSKTEKIFNKLVSANFEEFNLFILAVLSHGTQVLLLRKTINL